MLTLGVLREKSRGMTYGEIVREATRRGRSRLRKMARRAQAERGRAHARAPEADIALVLPLLRDLPAAAPGLRSPRATGALIAELLPDEAESTRREAAAIAANRIRLFGLSIDLGTEIDWLRDPCFGRRWPATHFSQVPIIFPEDASDIRRVWELNRLQHLVTLARAYAIDGGEDCAALFEHHVNSWVAANPVEFGPNWTNAMEVAIRSANLLIAAQILQRCGHGFEPAFERTLAATLVEHGRYIEDNLEFSHRVTSNHYISDLVGLVFLGCMLPCPVTSGWIEFALPELVDEACKQVNEDGTDYEASTGYHRLVLELLLHALLLARELSHDVPAEAWRRLARMFDVVRHTLSPAGIMPPIGDGDDARFVFWSEREALDQSYLLSIGAILNDDDSMRVTAYPSPEALWLFGEDGWETWQSLEQQRTPPPSKAFQDGGLVAIRGRRLFVLADCGGHGMGGRGSHNHNDTLSFELHVDGQRVLVDPGTYGYTGDYEWRDRFRSTLYHNTVRVDGEEISPPPPRGYFCLGPDPQARMVEWTPGPDRDELVVEHLGYRRLSDPVTHRRTLLVDHSADCLRITDNLEAKAEHQVEVSFTLDPALEVAIDDGIAVISTSTKQPVAAIGLRAVPMPLVSLDARWVSRAYGDRSPAAGLVWRGRVRLPFVATTVVLAAAAGENGEALIARTRAVCRA
jgi:uncharacterized heparinase superfamily protein